ncbi:hypothetical protein MBM_06348 [Drepanopeziza brunnea f. sp. 'multigermtubi' MB_m1]|uniref:Urease accessory protein n=1 Tax=Marssonina brunnea f. sp. multigermtubi (strain MB_m1) TaxID=1072389 RepID=K1WE94_MARBU|nr:uncharacterized protein MBM_06348 [Drepanopeziza brunnea f. sp. 'multigermtubi' MB_m1]EKD15720.1 hypothetical protein MBM_06348 [Drepanopeziza brunnea f. sp. 'multigermtubi' MB_m1]
MPHKHTRKGVVDKSTIDLPPSVTAKPLSTAKGSATNGIFTTDLATTKRANKKRKRKDTDDDTPKAFARLMAFAQGKKLPKGLDDGVKETKAEKKRKRAAESGAANPGEDQVAEKVAEKADVMTIRPGEKMSEFSARVDAALPVCGLINKSVRSGKDPLGLKVGRTKTERRMHRMYDEWRAEEARIQERRQAARELAEEEEEDSDGQVRWKAEMGAMGEGTGKTRSGKNKKKKKGKKIGEVDDGEDDPWAKVGRDRGEGKVAFGDVAQAPPVFTKAPGEKFKVRGARVEVEDVPKASGSLRRREELGTVRREVVEGYRRMMAAGKEKPTPDAEEA